MVLVCPDFLAHITRKGYEVRAVSKGLVAPLTTFARLFNSESKVNVIQRVGESDIS
jgi:hypothetical protein